MSVGDGLGCHTAWTAPSLGTPCPRKAITSSASHLTFIHTLLINPPSLGLYVAEGFILSLYSITVFPASRH